MGNHHENYSKLNAPPLKHVATEMSATTSMEDSVQEEYTTNENVCCFSCSKTVKRKIIWQTKFLQNCQQLQGNFEWAALLADLVSQNELQKVKYYKEVHYLKREKPVMMAKAQTDFLSNPDEVERFKKNLKKSVIISFAQSSMKPQPTPVIKSSITFNHLGASRKDNVEALKSGRANFAGSMALRKGSGNGSEVLRSKSRLSNVSRESSFASQQDVSKKTALQLQIFLKFSTILQRHLSDMSCVLGRMRKLFISHFQSCYRKPQQISQSSLNYVIQSIQQFLNLLKDATIDYYNLSTFAGEGQGSNMFISNEDNILSTCTAIIFRDHIFYHCLFSLLSYHLRDQQNNFNQILNHLKGSGPQRFTVKHKFCLNALTMKSYIRNLFSQSNNSSPNLVENVQINQVLGQHPQPYKNCMFNLNQMAKSRSPVNKLKSIMACSEGITLQIQKFYEINGLKKQKWMLDADQVLSIFCYLIVGARVEHLHTHLMILDNFSSSHQMMAMTGYYLKVIQCAVEQLENQFAESITGSQEGIKK